MAEVTGTRQPLIQAQAAMRRWMVEAFRGISDQASGILRREADVEGIIPLRREEAVKWAIGELVMGLMVASDGRSVFDEDGIGLSPYAQALNEQMILTTWGVLEAHRQWLERTLPDDLYSVLAYQPSVGGAVASGEMDPSLALPVNGEGIDPTPGPSPSNGEGNPHRPVATSPVNRGGKSDLVGEQGPEDDLRDLIVRPLGFMNLSARAQSQMGASRRRLAEEYARLRLFSPNPLAQYEWAHYWVDPNGYRLSDRIWQAAIRTRVKIDTFLAEAIRSGQSAEQIARRLEQFLVPGRAAIRTDRPYGRDASFDAMRLARTEITRAHSEAARLAAQRNPFVEAMDWRLSHSHPKPDICDTMADNGPYPMDQYVPIPVQDSHPQCLCHIAPVARPREQVVAEIRGALNASLEAEVYANITPVQTRALIELMVGQRLARLVLQGVA